MAFSSAFFLVCCLPEAILTRRRVITRAIFSMEFERMPLSSAVGERFSRAFSSLRRLMGCSHAWPHMVFFQGFYSGVPFCGPCMWFGLCRHSSVVWDLRRRPGCNDVIGCYSHLLDSRC